ncbi:MAG: TonB-dependent receptor [Steroidobacteraceae bacterium]|jgi:iron complex outermembrane receptor protein|nr:TonB-dependent receptor [Steroidobacteraceae bacterium]
MSQIRITSLLVASAVAAALPLRAAQAQDASDPVALQEIVVTAQKRTENLQDTPIAIAAINGQALERLNLASVSAIAAQTPSIAYSEAGGEAQVYIRGIGSNIFSIGVDQSVATHIDGVYIGRANMGLTQFLDVERIEVLRGPQGTLYGRNATGGAINIISRQPTDEVEGYASLLVGSFDRREVRAALSGPLGGGWSARVAVRGVQDDGYTEDLDPRGSNQIDDTDLQAVRGTLRWAGESLTASASVDYSEFSNGNTSIFPIDNVGLAESLGAVPTGDIHKTRNNTPSFHDWQTGGVTLNFDWKINDALTLSSVTGYREWDSDFLFNTDGTEIEVTRSSFIYSSSQVSTELRLAGDYDRGNFIIGAFYIDEDKFGGLGLVRAGFTPPLVQAPRSFVFLADGSGQASALFGEATYRLTDQWSVTAGIRYNDEEKDGLLSNVTLLPDTELLGLFSPRPLPAPTAAGSRNFSRSWSAWTPRFVVNWRPAEDQLYYVSYSEGFKSGGFNDLSVINPPFDPEFVDSYEIGAKTEWQDGRLRVNASAFYYDYRDLQVSVFANIGSITTTFTTNAAEATVQGLELEVQALPVRNLEIAAAISYLDATYDQFVTPYGTCSAANAALDSRCVGRPGLPRLIDAAGNRLNNAPEWKGNLSATYGIDLAAGGRVSLFAQVSHQGRVFFLPANTTVMSQAAYTLVDARVAYSNESGSLELAAFGRNLGDEEYFQNIVQFTSTSDGRRDPFNIGNALGYPAPGRLWGVELTYRFGK